MAGRPGRYQPRFVAGQVDKLLFQNTDEKIYERAASEMTNARVAPQGGFIVRDGMAKIDRVRNQLVAVTLSGGPAFPMTLAGVGANATVATFTLPGGVTCFDLVQFAASLPGGAAPTFSEPNPPLAPAIAGTVTVQYLVGAAWTMLDHVLALSDTLRTRRFALPAGQSVAATQIRVIVNCTTSGGCTFYCASVAAWLEGATLSAARTRPFSENVVSSYDLVFTQGNIEVYSSAGRVASMPMAMTSAEVAAFKNVQSFDTMILTHQDWAPQEIMRQGADGEWNIEPAQFPIVPLYDFGDVVYTNAVAQKTIVTFTNFDTTLVASSPLPTDGVTFTFTVNGETTAPLLPAPPYTSLYAWIVALGTGPICAAIAAAILALPNIVTGVTVAQYVPASGNMEQFEITFGGENAGTVFAVSGQALNKSDAAINASTYTQAVPGGEPIMSSSRGWPAACCLFQQRLLLGGFAGVPNGILASLAGNIYNLDTKQTLSTSAMLIVLDTLGNEGIIDLHIGRTLNIFTTRGEYWMQPGALSITSTPLIVYATNNGIASGVAPFENEGSTIYTHSNQGSLLEYKFDYAQQNYASTNISVTSSDLVQGIEDTAFRPQVASIDTADAYFIKSDGDVVLLSLLRSEQIQAYCGMATDGAFVAVDVNARFEVNFITERLVGGAQVQFFEKLTDGVYLDCAETVAIAAGAASISGLSDFEGATVWAVVDGYHQGPFTVSGGVIGLEFAALANGSAIVGRWTAPVVKTMPVPRDIAPGVVSRRPCRVHTVRAYVVGSTSLAIGANGSNPYDVALQFFGQAADTPPMSTPFTGWTLCEGIPGFSDDGIVEITQLRPGPLSLAGLVVEVDK